MPKEQKMLKGHLPSVIYHQVYEYTKIIKINNWIVSPEVDFRGPRAPKQPRQKRREREFFIGNLLVRIHCIIVMIRWTGLASWDFEFPFLDSLVSTFLR